METGYHYLDYNATSPLRPCVIEAMREGYLAPHNPSSVHKMGRQAHKMLTDARHKIASHLSCFANEIIFTSSGTEANNLVLRGFGERSLMVSAVEHASILKPAQMLGADILPVDENGLLRLDILEARLAALARPALISVMMVNNETGVIQPIADITKIAHAYGALVHTDAAQALGKIPLDLGILPVDMMTLCAHKIGGPVGAAALILRQNIAIKPWLLGGGQELGRRAGTEPLALIMGFAALIEEVAQCKEVAALLALRDMLEATIISIAADAHIFGASVARVCNTSSIYMPLASSETQLMHFDLSGFAVSAGSACSSGRIAHSHVLAAMGVEEHQKNNTIRVSLGWQTTQEAVMQFAQSWQMLYTRLLHSEHTRRHG